MNIHLILFISILTFDQAYDHKRTYPIWFHTLINNEEKANCKSDPLTEPRKRLTCETNTICNGAAIDRTWTITAAHCVLSYNIVRLDVSHGGDLEDGRIRFHYPISFVVINENFVRHKDTGDDIALIKLSHELSIPFDQFPTINYYKIQDRTKASIFTGERKSILMGEQNSINIELRNHECIQSQDKSLRDIRKALCYEILTTKRALSKMFDGAPIISYDIRNNNFIRHLIAIHIENYELNSHFLYIGRGLNIAWHFHWIKIAKFNRDASHIPSNKKFYCCDVKTLNTFNTEPYEGRSFAPIAVQRTKMCYKQ